MVAFRGGRPLPHEKFHHGQVDYVAETAQSVRQGIVENIKFLLQAVRDLVDHGIHVAGVIHHEISNL